MPDYRRQLIQQLFEQMWRVMRCLKGNRGQLFKRFGLSRAQAFVFFMVAHHPNGLAVKDLAAASEVTSGAVTQLIDGLVEQGLLERFEDKADRRIIRVKLSTKARKEFKAFKQTQFSDIAKIFNNLSDNEVASMVKLLGKIEVNN